MQSQQQDRLTMKTMILKLNHWLFRWYYSRVDEHFHQWTFVKSVKLLNENYEHQKILTRDANESYRIASLEVDKISKELSDIRMKQTATDQQIDHFNRIFGTDYGKQTDN